MAKAASTIVAPSSGETVDPSSLNLNLCRRAYIERVTNDVLDEGCEDVEPCANFHLDMVTRANDRSVRRLLHRDSSRTRRTARQQFSRKLSRRSPPRWRAQAPPDQPDRECIEFSWTVDVIGEDLSEGCTFTGSVLEPNVQPVRPDEIDRAKDQKRDQGQNQRELDERSATISPGSPRGPGARGQRHARNCTP